MDKHATMNTLSTISAVSACACRTSSFASTIAVRFFADCFFYRFYYLLGINKYTQRIAAQA